ncbi:MAG: hypothetical protein WBQ79_07450 [Acidobacteriaceae bacterium]
MCRYVNQPCHTQRRRARCLVLRLDGVYYAERGAAFCKHRTVNTRAHPFIVAKLGYYPNAHALSSQGSSGTIGVLVFDLSDPFCMPLVRGIQSGLQHSDYLPLVMDAQTERKIFDHQAALMLERVWKV